MCTKRHLWRQYWSSGFESVSACRADRQIRIPGSILTRPYWFDVIRSNDHESVPLIYILWIQFAIMSTQWRLVRRVHSLSIVSFTLRYIYQHMNFRKWTLIGEFAISPIVMSFSVSICLYARLALCLSVCLSVCLCVEIFRTGYIFAKIKKVRNTILDLDICHRMASLRKLYSVTLTYFLKVKNWNVYLWYGLLKNAPENFSRYWYLPSNCIISKIVIHGLYLLL